MKLPLLLVSVICGSIATVALDNANQTTAQTEVPQNCELQCENDGKCVYVSEDYATRKRLFQAGQMMQRCVCPLGYTGTGCEIKSTQCNVTSMTCPNGVACEGQADNGYHCDCSTAVATSSRAAQMCRRSYTEYCGSQYNPNTTLSYCTNGGKCKGSLIAARVAPGNTTINAKYEHAGCVCPPEFYGPHCEFLHHILTKTVAVSTPASSPGTNDSPTPLPTSVATTTAWPTTAGWDGDGSAQTVEDIISQYDSSIQNRSESTTADTGTSKSGGGGGGGTKRHVLLTIFLSVMACIGVFGCALGCLICRYRRQKRNKRRLASFFPKKGISSSKRTEARRRGRSKSSRTAPLTTLVKKQKRPIVLAPPTNEGTANLAPFVLDAEEEDDIEETDLHEDNDDDEYSMDSGIAVSAAPNHQDDSATVKTERSHSRITNDSKSNTTTHSDRTMSWSKAKSGSSRSSSTRGDEKNGSSLSGSPPSSPSQSAYLVEEEEEADTATYVVGNDDDDDDDDATPHLDSYAYHAYMVGSGADDDDDHDGLKDVGSGWKSSSSRGGVGGLV